jgi:hypothetical protein
MMEAEWFVVQEANTRVTGFLASQQTVKSLPRKLVTIRNLLSVSYVNREIQHMAELTVVNGLVGGLVATIVMTVFMMVLGDDSPPPTALFWSKYVGSSEPDGYMMQGMVLHMIYGVGAGLVFVLAAPVIGLSIGSMTTAVLFGLAYGFLLFVGAAVFWMNVVLDLDPEMPMVAMFLLFHLIYGVVLGVWLQLGLV